MVSPDPCASLPGRVFLARRGTRLPRQFPPVSVQKPVGNPRCAAMPCLMGSAFAAVFVELPPVRPLCHSSAAAPQPTVLDVCQACRRPVRSQPAPAAITRSWPRAARTRAGTLPRCVSGVIEGSTAVHRFPPSARVPADRWPAGHRRGREDPGRHDARRQSSPRPPALSGGPDPLPGR